MSTSSLKNIALKQLLTTYALAFMKVEILGLLGPNGAGKTKPLFIWQLALCIKIAAVSISKEKTFPLFPFIKELKWEWAILLKNLPSLEICLLKKIFYVF